MTKKRCPACLGKFPRTRGDYFKQRNQRLRWSALVFYGGPSPSCACCGEAEEAFLTIDHIAGGGNKHRKEQRNKNMADLLRREGYPPGFQVLCWNCNLVRATRGCCPHELQRIEEAAA